MKLRDISRSDRIDEMEFHFPVQASYRVFEFLQNRGYVGGIRTHEDVDIRGLMTGLVDLTFRHDGCYFIVDYKSNHLGSAFPDYEQKALNEAMNVHQYRLQYLIYTVAMTRHLQHTLPTFNYDQQFGGVYYLFLRGMHAKDNTGIYFDKPPAADIEALDALLNESTEMDVSRL